MKQILVPLGAAFAASVVTLTGSALLSEDRPAEAGPTATLAAPDELPAVADDAPRADATLVPDSTAQLARIEERLDELTRRLDSLGRTPIAGNATVAATARDLESVAAALEANPAARELILGVMESEKAREAAEREQAEAERREARLRRQADAIAAAVGLPAEDTDKLVTVLMKESDQRDALREDMRSGLLEGDRASIRAEFEAISDWKYEELGRQLGVDTSTLIQEYDQSQRGNRFGGNRGPQRQGRSSGG
jgi:hypothetical protein